MPTFADIILPVAVPGTFSYAVPPELEGKLGAGMRVVVGFGAGRKLYSGMVRRTHTNDPSLPRIKSVLSLLDEAPVVNEHQLLLWERVAEHYMCSLGEVMLAALPGQLVLTSETRLIASNAPRENWTGDPRQDLMLDALEQRHELSLAQAGELLGMKNPMPVIERLMAQGALMLAEEIAERPGPRTDRFVEPVIDTTDEAVLHHWFDSLERAPKLLAMLMKYVELSQCLSGPPLPVKRDRLLRASGSTAAHLRKLQEKGLFTIVERPVGTEQVVGAAAPKALSPAQRTAHDALIAGLAEKKVALLQGVTASGKTEVYMELIAQAIASGRQALYLLPEIALTAQVIGRLRARFGSNVAVYHSRLAPRDRAELWARMAAEPDAFPLVLGARSALFLPFQRLGLVIVDEEHDTSYKQQDPAPRYHARDMAVVLGALHEAPVVLGSATPSMESMFNARTGKYANVLLSERFGDAAAPRIETVDITDAQKRKRMRGSFSTTLIEAITDAIARKEQAIVFQNRRGYVPVWQCETCGWIPECDHCDVSLTYHKQGHGLRCHYCGRGYEPPVKCSACGSARLRMIGVGTEKIEEELAMLLPEARIARMDQDTTRGKHAFDRILDRFGEGQVDVLVGTQMVTKGLDFDQVTVVGIINADHLLRFPDLRAHERAFQLMSQVAGRSGRRRDQGTVYIQSRDVHDPVIGFVKAHDVDGMYRHELAHRRTHGYPPITRLVRFTLKHRVEERTAATAEALASMLRPHFGERVLGPEAPVVSRIRDKHLRNILVKLDRAQYRAEKWLMTEAIDRLFALQEHRAVQLVVDVDPT